MGSPAQLVLTWIVMLALLALSAASVYLPLGALATVIQFGTAVVIIGLLAFYWMQLRTGSTTVRIAAVVALFFLAILTLLSFNDYMTRQWDLAPYDQLPGVAAPM